QHMVENSIRGRIMSLYSFMFVGMAPFGNYLIGYLADKYGSPMAIRLFIIVVIVFGIFMFFLKNKIVEAHKVYSNNQN
ncbi:MAG: MFS transporter, partial [bacterium]|nr:MFS transporter [bacterium]